MTSSDLQIQPISEALRGLRLDVIVSGSIGAVEAVRFIRALRRLGAEVYPVLTEGGAMFTTETALSWAAARPTVTGFSATASHIFEGDACIVAPASASMIAKTAHGITDTPASALIASCLGLEKPVFLVPNMHDSLSASPAVRENLDKIRVRVRILDARREEGKHKFPDPVRLADEIAHQINLTRQSAHKPLPPVMVSMGTTRGYVDDVRYFSNYSSGALGSMVSEEIYRRGIPTTVVCGPCQIKPAVFSKLIDIETNGELLEACRKAVQEDHCAGAVLAASVLDFIPDKKITGKIKSDQDLQVNFIKSSKIIAEINPPVKVGFKLEANLDEQKALSIAKDYFSRYQLSLMILNQLSDVDSTRHKAFTFENSPDNFDPQ